MSHLSTATPSPCPLPAPLAAAARVLKTFTASVAETPTPPDQRTSIAAMLARLRACHARRLAESRIAARAALFAPYSKSPRSEARAEAFFQTPKANIDPSREAIADPRAQRDVPAEAALVQSANAASANFNAAPPASPGAPPQAALGESANSLSSCPDTGMRANAVSASTNLNATSVSTTSTLPDPHEWTEAEVVDTIFRALRDAYLNGGELNRSALLARGITHALIDLCEGEAWRRFTAWRDARMARRG